MTKDADVLHYAGDKLSVWFVRLADQSVPAQEFLDELNPKCRAGFLALFKRLGDAGSIHNRERFVAMKDSNQIMEFKVHDGHGWRMWGKYGPEGMFVTHGAKKPGKRQVKRETTRSESYFEQRRTA